MTANSTSALAEKKPKGPRRSGGAAQVRSALVTGVAVVIVAVLLLLSWQWTYDRELMSNIVLPSPKQTWDAFQNGVLTSDLYWPHIWATTWATLIAVALGLGIGVAFGALFAFVPLARRTLYPFVLVGLSFPKIAVAPLFVLWFGYGLSSKVAVGASIAFFPVLANTAAGLREVSRDEIELFDSNRATAWQQFRLLRVPRALAFILPSLDLAIVGALLGVIAGEFVASGEGLGFLVLQFSQNGDAPGVFAALFCMAIVGLAMKALAVALMQLGPKNVTPN